MESKIFQTVKDFKKEYDAMRSDILERHGIKEGQRARLKNAIMMYQKFNCGWVKITSIKTDMIQTIKIHEELETKFMLKAMV
ncbi:hypothetical protein MOE90_20905 [Bacillus spizizenii]|nr:hypothetical protein [Bacillus spizizenii]MCY9125029.1 hypothetical protein [Bacillus spizizenii]